MVAVVIWSLAAVGIFFWNHYQSDYIGIRFTEDLLGFPVNGGWLCGGVALYCLVRYFYRKQRKDNRSGDGPPPVETNK